MNIHLVAAEKMLAAPPPPLQQVSFTRKPLLAYNTYCVVVTHPCRPPNITSGRKGGSNYTSASPSLRLYLVALMERG